MPDHAISTDPAVQRQLDRLWSLSPGADILGLERITELLARLGNPHEHVPPVLHVAGTNGKGSTCAFLRAAIEAAGYTCHVYSSPHLVRFNERIRLAGKLIEDEVLAPLLEEVLDAGGDIGASFFEVTTAAAFLAFSRIPADACVIEVGLGGRLDATNVIAHPAVTGIAQLGIDHQHFLGDTIEEIAGEKAGIAKTNVPLVTMRYQPSVEARVAAVARSAGTRVSPAGENWFWSAEADHLAYRDAAGRIDTPLPRLTGAHQPGNLALAIAMLRHQHALTIPAEAMAAAATSAIWPARMQRLSDGPLTRLLPPAIPVWLDGGHNPAAGDAIAASIAQMRLPGKVTVVLGMLANKDVAGLLAPIAPLIGSLIAVPVGGHECHSPDHIAAVARELGIDSSTARSVRAALETIGDTASGAVLILGSLYLAGEVLAANDEAPD
jgi:dihydrofolate synthase/folylpolyglutamate synthase